MQTTYNIWTKQILNLACEDTLCGTTAIKTKSGLAFHFTFSTEISGNLLAVVLLIYGPGSNPSGDEIFRPSRPALRHTQPHVKWVPGLSGG